MAYVPEIPYEEADGRLARLYDRYRAPWGGVDHILRVHSLNPPSMEHHVRLYAHLMRGPSPLSRAQREMIAVTVSAENDCSYCMTHHGAAVRNLTDDAGLVEDLLRDHRSAGLPAADRAMLDYAVKLTRTPGEVEEADVDELREAGFDDRAVLDICQVVAYFNYVNRLAEGLGVELEEYWSREDARHLMGSAADVEASHDDAAGGDAAPGAGGEAEPRA